MKLSQWLTMHRSLLTQAHVAWGSEKPDWGKVIIDRYGPHGTARYLFGRLDEMARKEIVVSAIADYLRGGKPFSLPSIDGFVAQAVRSAPAPSAAAPQTYRPSSDPDPDPGTTANGIRLLKEAVGRYGCGCRVEGGPMAPRRKAAADCDLDHAVTDASYAAVST